MKQQNSKIKALPGSACKDKLVGATCMWSKIVSTGRGLFDENGSGTCQAIRLGNVTAICCSSEPWCTKKAVAKKAMLPQAISGSRRTANGQMKPSQGRGIETQKVSSQVPVVGRVNQKRRQKLKKRTGRTLSQKVKRKPVFLIKNRKKKRRDGKKANKVAPTL